MSINNNKNSLSYKQTLKKSFEEGLIDEEKYKEELFKLAISKPTYKKQKRQYEGLTDEEFLKLLKTYNKKTDKKHKIILLLAYGSGLRLQEILNLEKDDINFDTKEIKVRRGKFGKDRITYLSKYFKRDYLKEIPFTNKQGKKLSKVAIQKKFNKNSLACGINKIIDTYELKSGKKRNIYKYHFHCLRHSFAINLLKKGMPLNYVQKLLGHANISSTSVYTNINAKEAIKLAIEKEL